jgi:hypothetical protein
MRSLRRCHVIVDDLRAKLVAANSNEPPFMLAKDDGELPFIIIRDEEDSDDEKEGERVG